MRGRIVLAVIVTALVSFSAIAADVVVLKDGRAIALTKPYVVKGKMAILTLPDKTVLSVPLAEIDKAKTAEAKARPAAPAPAPAPIAKPLTPAEAAKVKSSRKAVVSLTDDTVSHPIATGGEGGAAASEGGSRLEVGSVSVKREKTGYAVTGSLMNAGKGEAVAVTMTVEAMGDDGKPVASGFAELARDTLTAGEKTTFTAQIATDVAVTTFNYVPRWKEKAPSRLTIATGSEDGTGEQKPAEPPATEVPAAENRQPPPPPQEQAPPPRPDVAAPPAQAPVGQPSEPGGVYVPQPSPEGQPKLP